MAKKPTNEDVGKFTVELGGVGYAKTPGNIRISCRIAAEEMSIEQAERLLLGTRVQATLTTKLDDAQAELFPDDTRPKLNVQVDIKGYVRRPDGFSFGMGLKLDNQDASKAFLFSGKSAKLTIKRLGDAAELDASSDEEGDDDQMAIDDVDGEDDQPASRRRAPDLKSPALAV